MPYQKFDNTVTTMFVGRQAEVDLLTHTLQVVAGGIGQMMFVVGEAGIGKTSMAQVFAEGARQWGAVVLWGRCFEGEWQPPYGPWVEALSEYAQTIAPERLQRLLGLRAACCA